MKAPKLWIFFLLGLGACSKTDPILRIYTSSEPEVAQRLVSLYKEETGQIVEYVRLSAGEALARIRTESKNPKASLWMVGSSTEYSIAAEEGLFEAYQPKMEFKLEPPYRDKAWRWTGIYVGAIGFGSNRNILKKMGVSPPTSWQDLLKPEYKNKVGYAYPYTSGTALTVMFTVVKVMGEKAAFEFFKNLDGQVHQYMKSGSACINQVGLGEIGVCISFAHDILSKGVEKGYPIELTFPREGTGTEITGSALLKGGPQPEQAKRFLDWLHGPNAQTVFEQWHGIPLHPGVTVRPPTVRMADIKVVNIDTDWASQNQRSLLEKWRKATGK